MSGFSLAVAPSSSIRYPCSMTRVLHWNGKDLPDELRELPAGSYIVAEYQPADLTPEEEAEIEVGLDEIDRGETVSADEVHASIDEMLRHR
jgi:hypothetical protein